MTSRAYYADSIASFLATSDDAILGRLTGASAFAIEPTQRDAWIEQIRLLRTTLVPYAGRGSVYFEYSIPRMGRRIDVVAIIRHVIFVIEFKVGEATFSSTARDQVWDYALDLKNFQERTHHELVVPILVATGARDSTLTVAATPHDDGLLPPICASAHTFAAAIEAGLAIASGSEIDAEQWQAGRYSPTPTIIEAAMALYGRHSVEEISRSDAGATNLRETSACVARIIADAREHRRKSICFVTGVPGAGKTLVGLNVATTHTQSDGDLRSVFLSGNGPLVAILREALARDKRRREQEAGKECRLGIARSEVKTFIQNVHHFRDDCLQALEPPPEHVALFDEAQRAWNLERTASFMKRKKGRPDFGQSEPEFLISCMDRHVDWAVIVCLVGGGQEINTGEAGIREWIDALNRSFGHWHIHISPRLHDSEYGAGAALDAIQGRENVHHEDSLHLGVSMRSFRAEHVSSFVKAVLDREIETARHELRRIRDRYPLRVTRHLPSAKAWLRARARGTERYGIVVSSQAQRLKPHAIDVRSPMDPIHWFLGPKEDVRSSFYLEDVATEFHVQGLELDWAAVVWDADFRATRNGWSHHSFVGEGWNKINKSERKAYLKNAYRVLLTRARQGMVVVVPEGDPADPTRDPQFYDETYEYLRSVGVEEL